MRRILGIATAVLIALPMLGGTATAATTGAAAATCTAGAGTINITQLAFNPASVAPGQSSTLNLTAVNCTSQSVTASLISYGTWSAPGSNGVPPGCPAIDPLSQPVTIPPNGTYTTGMVFPVFSSCTATALQGVVRFSSSTGGTLAQGTAQLTIVQPVPPTACHVAYSVSSEWNGGLVASINITNTGTVADNGWKLAFTFGGDEKIVGAWGAAFQQTGNSVTMTNLSYDATIAPGSTVGIGFQGTWTSSDAGPSGFSVNGVACS